VCVCVWGGGGVRYFGSGFGRREVVVISGGKTMTLEWKGDLESRDVGGICDFVRTEGVISVVTIHTDLPG
jgi:hypothetical protein